MSLEDRYRRLLRWYPRAWRDRDRGVLLGTLLDAAEERGRTRPTVREAASIRVHGLAAHADRRTAIAASSVACAIGVAAFVLSFVPGAIAGWTLGLWASTGAVVLVPVLLLGAAAALLRSGGAIGTRRTLALPLLGAVAGPAAAVAVQLRTLAFDAADTGRPMPDGTGPLAIGAIGAAWLAGGAAVAVVLHAALGRAGAPAALRTVPALVAGAVAAPVLGLVVLQPGGCLLVGAALLALAILLGAGHRPAAPAAPLRAIQRGDRSVVPLAALGTSAALASLVLCFVGGPLGILGLDGTQAMGAGLGLAALAGLLVLAAGARTAAPSRAAVLLAAAGLVVTAAGRLLGPSSDAVLPVALAAGCLLAAAVAVLVRPRLPGTATSQTALAALLATVLAVLSPVLVLAAGFLVPVAGVLVLLRGRRSRRPPAAEFVRAEAPEQGPAPSVS